MVKPPEVQKSTRNFWHGLDFRLLTPWKINNFVDPLKPRSLAYYDCDSKLMLLGKYNNRARILWGGYRIEEKSVRLKLNDEHKGLNTFLKEPVHRKFTKDSKEISCESTSEIITALEYWIGFYGEKTDYCGKEYLPNHLENW